MLPTVAGNVILTLSQEDKPHEIHWQDNVLIGFALIIGFLLDAFVLYKELQWDTFAYFAEFLTNQVFLVGMFSKFLLLLYMIDFLNTLAKLAPKEVVIEVNPTWLRSMFVGACFSVFLGYGACLCGVYGAFFMLVYLDDTLLSEMVCGNTENNYKVGEVLIWNHLRHVFVLFVHITLLWSLRRHMYFWYTEHFKGDTCAKTRFVMRVLIIPIIVGVVHKLTSNDESLYKYHETTIGASVTLMFAISCFLALFYYWIVIQY